MERLSHYLSLSESHFLTLYLTLSHSLTLSHTQPGRQGRETRRRQAVTRRRRDPHPAGPSIFVVLINKYVYGPFTDAQAAPRRRMTKPSRLSKPRERERDNRLRAPLSLPLSRSLGRTDCLTRRAMVNSVSLSILTLACWVRGTGVPRS